MSFNREVGRNRVLETLSLTRLCLLHWENLTIWIYRSTVVLQDGLLLCWDMKDDDCLRYCIVFILYLLTLLCNGLYFTIRCYGRSQLGSWARHQPWWVMHCLLSLKVPLHLPQKRSQKKTWKRWEIV